MKRQTGKGGETEGDPKIGMLEGAGKGKPGSQASCWRTALPASHVGRTGEGVTRTSRASGFQGVSPSTLPDQGREGSDLNYIGQGIPQKV